MQPEEVAAAVARRIESVVIGQSAAVELLLAALGARAHVLLEGVPGTAKTLLAATIARCAGLHLERVHLTPDFDPRELLGSRVWLADEGRFQFRPGPVFGQMLLADELERAAPRAQAALLEAMQEGQVTCHGATRLLDRRFWLVATRNPFETQGVFPMPDSELDRFGLRVVLDCPSASEERSLMLAHREADDPHARLASLTEPVISPGELSLWQQHVARVHVADSVVQYMLALVRATRQQPELTLGAGPRASVWLLRCSQALALGRRRAYVLPDDVRDLVVPVLEHRLRLAPEAQIAGLTPRSVLGRLLSSITGPAVPLAVASART
jgi:MoxR-like ATPase